MLGKFGQDTSGKTNSVTINSQAELNDLFWREDLTVQDYIVMSPHVVEVSVQNKAAFTRPNLKSNAILAAYVTAYARCEMDRAIRKLLQHGITIYYSDTGKHNFPLFFAPYIMCVLFSHLRFSGLCDR